MRTRLFVVAMMLAFVLVSATSFATPMTTCSEEYEHNRNVASTDLESCLTHSGGNFVYASGCLTVFAETLAVATVIYEACSLIQSGG